jgi:hypothetical protein
MKTYTALFAEDVPHYCAVEIEAETDEQAIKQAKGFHGKFDIDFDDPDWNNPVCQRIVHILDNTGVEVATDISLDGHHLLTDSKVCDAIQHALECLRSFKADWLANHGLNVAVEKLEAAYKEMGGAA